MAQLQTTCDVTNGSPTVSFPAGTDLSSVLANHVVIVGTDGVPYFVSSVNDGADTITLTGNYLGTTASTGSGTGTTVVVHLSITSPDNIPYPEAGDIRVITITKAAIQNIQSIMAASPIYRGAGVYLDAAQSTTSGVGTTIFFDQEITDTDTIHDNVTNPGRLTVPSGVTKIRLISQVTFEVNSAGLRTVQINKNGGVTYVGSGKYVRKPNSTERTVLKATTAVINVTAGDYFELFVTQDSGSAVNVVGTTSGVDTWFQMEIRE